MPTSISARFPTETSSSSEPARLTASLTTARWGLTTLVIEAKDQPGGQSQFLYTDKRIVDVRGFPDEITGEELSLRVFRQAQDALVQFRFNEEVVAIDDTDQVEKEDSLKQVETNRGSYLCRKVILAFGLLHFPPKLAALDRLGPKKVHYKTPKIRDYEGSRVLVVGGGDSALDATMMVLARNGMVEMVVREEVPVGKSDTRGRVGGGNTGRDLRVQGNHQPILVEREASARQQGRLDRRKDHPSRPTQPPAHKVGDRPREMPRDPQGLVPRKCGDRAAGEETKAGAEWALGVPA